MIDALLIFAVFCACLGSFSRGEDGRIAVNVTALALLASVATTSVFVWTRVPFNFVLWIAIDWMVIVLMGAEAFVRSRLLRPEIGILLLFPLAWYFYTTPVSHKATTIIVSLQLLLTFPAANVWKRIKQKRAEQPDRWNEFDLRAVHEPGG